MLFDAKIYKDGKFWLAEIPTLDAMTQGRTKAKAIAMLKDWVKSSVDGVDVKIHETLGGGFVVVTDDSMEMFAFLLQRQRLKAGLTVRQVAHKLGFKSHNGYAQYERGQHELSLSQLQKFLTAISPARKAQLKIS